MTENLTRQLSLLQIIEKMADDAPDEGLSLKHAMERLDESAFGAILFLLALPCCIPFLYVVPQIVSLPMMALAAQMAMGRDEPWMPEKFASRMIDKAGLLQTAKGGRKWLGWVEVFSKPRLSFITGPLSERVIGALLIVFSASILLPFPLTNSGPAFAVALAAFGLINKDGILVILGVLLGTLWISALLIVGPAAVLTGISFIKDWISSLYG